MSLICVKMNLKAEHTFHVNGFARIPVLTHRQKATWKWLIEQTTRTCRYKLSFVPTRRLLVLNIFCFPFFPHSASSLCFAEKTIYTQEVLAVVLHQLMEMNPLPTLFMRTVIFFIPFF